MSEVQQIDPRDLKIQALLERVSSLTANYENQVADLRVEITVIGQQLREAQEQLEEANDDVEEEKPKKK